MSYTITNRRHEPAHADVASEHEDNELLRRIAAQDRKAFETLYHRYASRLGSYLFKLLARAAPRSWVPLEDGGTGADGGDADPPALASHDSPERSAMGAQLGRSLADALAALSPEHRAVIELAFVESLGYEDIARVMDCPVNTVKTRMFHARKKLSELMEQRGHAV